MTEKSFTDSSPVILPERQISSRIENYIPPKHLAWMNVEQGRFYLANKDKVDALQKKPPFKNKHTVIARVTIYPKDGVVAQTGQKEHFSWWRTTAYDISEATIL